MKRLSIIVPMYNIEPFLERCIISLEDQDIPESDYEVICVNDGSPDNSSQVIKGLQKKYQNIILIDQENQGVSLARNNGMNKAEGKYMLFIDPDDYIDINSLSRVLDYADKYNAEVSFLGFTFLNEDGSIRREVFNENYIGNSWIGTEAYFRARGDGRTDPDRMVAVLFNSKFMNCNNLRYLPEVPFLEDGELIARILCVANCCVFDGNSFYQRTSRPGSATNSNLFHSNKATKGFLLAAKNLKTFQQREDLNDIQRDFLNQPIAKFVLLSVHSTIDWKINNRYKLTVRTLKTAGLRKIKYGSGHWTYRLFGKAYNLYPLFGVLLIIVNARFERWFLFLFRREKD